MNEVPARIARTGYTGEDGFEVYVAPDFAEATWDALLDAGQEFGIKPCGLGARNTLRLEAKMALYGHEIGPTINPLEAGPRLDREIRQSRTLSSKQALEKQKADGVSRKLAGFEMRGRGIGRDGYEVQVEWRACGLGHQRWSVADAEQEYRTLLSAGAIKPCPARRSRSWSAISRLRLRLFQLPFISERNELSRKFSLHERTRVGVVSRAISARSASPIMRSMSSATSSLSICRRREQSVEQGNTLRFGRIGEGCFGYLFAGFGRSCRSQRACWPRLPKSSMKIRMVLRGW